ncbi:MAG: NfeD family protein [Bacteroidales bacterium]|jgi:membrane-bound serine protease (ClpP class)|nr:nodulation protein NfeD [Bacteroidales bacterium]MDD2204043.1 NfeD family protein [Bacteroidales bacterium]MDD3152134.1 NfeD family protein [Bacteroidales bacterium]MDD3913369.1 NfeD family protein [Bacteroidales bacterium]MDD4633164.1 NfeD family protein [Bacteroidales bacterium]
MNIKHLMIFICGFFLLFCGSCALKVDSTLQDEKHRSTVYVIDIMDEIAPPTWRKVKLGFEEARQKGADLILLHLNTYGGTLGDADSIRTKILNSSIPVYVFIDNNAASAGALISIACDSIYMRQGANIGAATVVNQNSEALPDKYQSFMRSMMRSTAEAKGRDPKIAEAMVDPDVFIPNLSDSGKVLTFTVDEAILNCFCEGKADNIEEVITKANLNNPQIIIQTLSPLDKIINFLINPIISGLLIMMIVGGIYFEMQTPGIGFPLAIAILGACLYFFPLYAGGLAEYWEIILFILGIILLALEIFVIPGFGVCGVLGIIAIITGLAFALVPNNGLKLETSDFTLLGKALLIVVVASTAAFILSIILGKKLLTTNNKLINIALKDVQNTNDGYSFANKQYEKVIGKQGVAHSVLRPAGKILVEDDVFDAMSEGGWIDKDEKITVVDYINGQLIVRKLKS